jgi:hypothetical protein
VVTTNLAMSLIFWVVGSIMYTAFSQVRTTGRAGAIWLLAILAGFAATQWVGIWFMVG